MQGSSSEAIMAYSAATTHSSTEIYWLPSDILRQILSTVDGATLATAGCVCNEFGCIARDEALWESACYSLCPSTALDRSLHHFISSSFGGFKKFYAHSFPFIFHRFHDDDSRDSPGNSNVSPSDFVSIVDVQYGQKSVYSKVLWGIPDADDLQGWFCNCPFRIDLLSFSSNEDENDAESSANSPAVVVDAEGLPSVPVPCAEEDSTKQKFWSGEVMHNMTLSWVVLDITTKRAVNLSSGRPLGVQRQLWDSNCDYVLRFGSILPPAACDTPRGGAVLCMILMKCRISGVEGESSRRLSIEDLGLQLEDVAGGHVNGENSLRILERAMGCRRTTKRSEVVECYHRFLKARSDFDEAKTSREARFDTICLLSGIAFFALFCYVIFH